jgi:hypothetical protein
VSRFRKAASGMTLAEHLAEARQRFLISAATLLVFGVVHHLPDHPEHPATALLRRHAAPLRVPGL